MKNFSVIWHRDCENNIEKLNTKIQEECFEFKKKRRFSGTVLFVSAILLIMQLYVFVTQNSYIESKLTFVFIVLITAVISRGAMEMFLSYTDYIAAGGSKKTLYYKAAENLLKQFFERYQAGSILSIDFDIRLKCEGFQTKYIVYTYETLSKSVATDEFILDRAEIKTNITIPTIHATDEEIVLQMPYKEGKDE